MHNNLAICSYYQLLDKLLTTSSITKIEIDTIFQNETFSKLWKHAAYFMVPKDLECKEDIEKLIKKLRKDYGYEFHSKSLVL